jgi:hypothetical protein
MHLHHRPAAARSPRPRDGVASRVPRHKSIPTSGTSTRARVSAWRLLARIASERDASSRAPGRCSLLKGSRQQRHAHAEYSVVCGKKQTSVLPETTLLTGTGPSGIPAVALPRRVHGPHSAGGCEKQHGYKHAVGRRTSVIARRWWRVLLQTSHLRGEVLLRRNQCPTRQRRPHESAWLRSRPIPTSVVADSHRHRPPGRAA